MKVAVLAPLVESARLSLRFRFNSRRHLTPGGDLSHIPYRCKIKGFSGEDATPALVGADVVLISGVWP